MRISQRKVRGILWKKIVKPHEVEILLLLLLLCWQIVFIKWNLRNCVVLISFIIFKLLSTPSRDWVLAVYVCHEWINQTTTAAAAGEIKNSPIIVTFFILERIIFYYGNDELGWMDLVAYYWCRKAFLLKHAHWRTEKINICHILDVDMKFILIDWCATLSLFNIYLSLHCLSCDCTHNS